MPGVTPGRGPIDWLTTCIRTLLITEMAGMPLSSVVITSEKARPIQSADASGERFSKRRIARRCTAGVAVCREQEASNRTQSETAAVLQYTRFQGQEQLEFRRFFDGGELRVV